MEPYSESLSTLLWRERAWAMEEVVRTLEQASARGGIAATPGAQWMLDVMRGAAAVYRRGANYPVQMTAADLGLEG